MGKILKIFLSILLIVVLEFGQTVQSSEIRWYPMNEGLPNPEIIDLEICPGNPKILYAVAKEASVYKSVDGGESWVLKNSGLEDIDIKFLKADPNRPNVICAIGSQLFISEDAGDSWSTVDLPEEIEITCLSIDPKDSKIIFLGTKNQGILKSIDYGKTWMQVSVGLRKDEYLNYPSINCIFFDFYNEETLYAGTMEGIFKTKDSGKSWEQIINGLIYKAKITLQKPEGPIEVEVELTATVYTGFVFSDPSGKALIGTNVGIFTTSDGGNSWTKINETEGMKIKTLKIGKDQTRIVAISDKYILDSSDGGLTWKKSELEKDFTLNDVEINIGEQTEIYFATDLGVLKSKDGGKSYINSNEGILCLDVSSITPSLDNKVIYLSTYNYGLFKYDLLNKKWGKLSNIGEEIVVNSVACDVYEKNTLYIGTDEGILISRNGGDAFDLRIESLNYVYSLICPKENILIAGTSNGIFRSEDKGITWKEAFKGETEDITVISLANTGDGVIYAGTISNGILKSSDYGKTWLSVNNGLETPYPPINAISVNPNNPSFIYAGTEGSGLLKSIDGGDTWKPTADYITPWVKDLAINKQGEIYAIFSPKGIYRSLDGGENWIEVNSNLPSKEIFKLAFVEDEILAGTKAGIYRSTIFYNIKVTYSKGGSVFPESLSEIKQGDSKTFAITPSSGYKIKDVKVDGISKGSISSYTFTNITSDHTISVTFEKEITQTVIILQIGNSTFTINGITNTLDSPPIIKNNRTLLPIRAVVEALGGTVGWDGTTKKVTVSLGSTTIELWIGKSIAKVNGIDTPIDPANSKVVPEIINSRTMLPLRFVTESLGCDVQWDGTTKTITITYGG